MLTYLFLFSLLGPLAYFFFRCRIESSATHLIKQQCTLAMLVKMPINFETCTLFKLVAMLAHNFGYPSQKKV